MPKTHLPFGFEIETEILTEDGWKIETLYFRGCTEAAARRKARLKGLKLSSQCKAIVLNAIPIDEPTWIARYGLGRM